MDTIQLDLFKAQFSQILNPVHPLLMLAEKIDWNRFDLALDDCFCPDFGAPALPGRLPLISLVRILAQSFFSAFSAFSAFQKSPPLCLLCVLQDCRVRSRAGGERLPEGESARK